MNEDPRLSITQTTALRWSLPDLVTYCKDFGFPGIGVWLPRLCDFGEERGIDLICDAGLQVSSVGPVGGFTGANGQSFKDAVLDTADALEIAGRLDAHSLTICTGSRNYHARTHLRRIVKSALLRLADRAGELDVALTLKPMHRRQEFDWTFLNRLDETMDLIDDCDHPNVKLAFGTFHLCEEPDLLRQIPHVAPAIGSVQLCDGVRNESGMWEQHLFGEGDLPLDGIVQALIDAEFSGLFEIDIWSRPLWNSNYEDLLTHCRDRFVRTLAIRR